MQLGLAHQYNALCACVNIVHINNNNMLIVKVATNKPKFEDVKRDIINIRMHNRKENLLSVVVQVEVSWRK